MVVDFLTVDGSQNLYRIKMMAHNRYLKPEGIGNLANVYWSTTNDDWCLWQLEEYGKLLSKNDACPELLALYLTAPQVN